MIRNTYSKGQAHPVKYPVMCSIIRAMPVAPVVPIPLVCGTGNLIRKLLA